MSAKCAWSGATLATFICLTCAGCGGDPGYNLSGKVTFAGKPIPQGKIYFTPDGAKGNTGAPGYADIKDGTYNTASAGGKKHIGGPMQIRIEGFDPTEKGEDSPSEAFTIKALFPSYDMTADLDKSAATKDFDVPATASERQESSQPPMITP